MIKNKTALTDFFRFRDHFSGIWIEVHVPADAEYIYNESESVSIEIMHVNSLPSSQFFPVPLSSAGKQHRDILLCQGLPFLLLLFDLFSLRKYEFRLDKLGGRWWWSFKRIRGKRICVSQEENYTKTTRRRRGPSYYRWLGWGANFRLATPLFRSVWIHLHFATAVSGRLLRQLWIPLIRKIKENDINDVKGKKKRFGVRITPSNRISYLKKKTEFCRQDWSWELEASSRCSKDAVHVIPPWISDNL